MPSIFLTRFLTRSGAAAALLALLLPLCGCRSAPVAPCPRQAHAAARAAVQEPFVPPPAPPALPAADAADAAPGRVVLRTPSDPSDPRAAALALMESGDLRAAAAVLARGVADAPDDRSLPIVLARVHESLEEWPEAARCYSLLLRHEPHNLDWRRRRAACFYRSGDLRAACADYAAVAGHDLDALPLDEQIDFGDACLQIGAPGWAGRVFDRLSQRTNRESMRIEQLRAICALRQGNRGQAVRVIDASLAIWPDDPEFRRLRLLAFDGPGETALDGFSAAGDASGQRGNRDLTFGGPLPGGRREADAPPPDEGWRPSRQAGPPAGSRSR